MPWPCRDSPRCRIPAVPNFSASLVHASLERQAIAVSALFTVRPCSRTANDSSPRTLGARPISLAAHASRASPGSGRAFCARSRTDATGARSNPRYGLLTRHTTPGPQHLTFFNVHVQSRSPQGHEMKMPLVHCSRPQRALQV